MHIPSQANKLLRNNHFNLVSDCSSFPSALQFLSFHNTQLINIKNHCQASLPFENATLVRAQRIQTFPVKCPSPLPNLAFITSYNSRLTPKLLRIHPSHGTLVSSLNPYTILMGQEKSTVEEIKLNNIARKSLFYSRFNFV